MLASRGHGAIVDVWAGIECIKGSHVGAVVPFSSPGIQSMGSICRRSEFAESGGPRFSFWEGVWYVAPDMCGPTGSGGRGGGGGDQGMGGKRGWYWGSACGCFPVFDGLRSSIPCGAIGVVREANLLGEGFSDVSLEGLVGEALLRSSSSPIALGSISVSMVPGLVEAGRARLSFWGGARALFAIRGRDSMSGSSSSTPMFCSRGSACMRVAS